MLHEAIKEEKKLIIITRLENWLQTYGGRAMKNKMKKNISKILAICAMVMSVTIANQNCVFIYHQEEKPDELRRLRRFW